MKFRAMAKVIKDVRAAPILLGGGAVGATEPRLRAHGAALLTCGAVCAEQGSGGRDDEGGVLGHLRCQARGWGRGHVRSPNRRAGPNRARFTCSNARRDTIHESVDKADAKVKMTVENIAGVMLPDFVVFQDTNVDAANILPGLAKGGEAVTKAKKSFSKALELLVRLAGLQTSFLLLDEAIKVRFAPCARDVLRFDCRFVCRLRGPLVVSRTDAHALCGAAGDEPPRECA